MRVDIGTDRVRLGSIATGECFQVASGGACMVVDMAWAGVDPKYVQFVNLGTGRADYGLHPGKLVTPLSLKVVRREE